jgi:hypothetical protein
METVCVQGLTCPHFAPRYSYSRTCRVTSPYQSGVRHRMSFKFSTAKNMRGSIMQMNHFKAYIFCGTYVSINWTVLFYLLLF